MRLEFKGSSWVLPILLSLSVHTALLTFFHAPAQRILGHNRRQENDLEVTWELGPAAAPRSPVERSIARSAHRSPAPLPASSPSRAALQGPVSRPSSATPQPKEASAIPGDLRWRSLVSVGSLIDNPWAGLRVPTLSSGTQDEVWGSYEAAFCAKVAQVGALNYPAGESGRPLSGAVRVATTLNPDGSVAAVEILRGSDEPLLNQAALRIVRMAAPFQTFTEAMRAQADKIRIERTFNFIHSGELLESH